jgi:hypothetical protein
MTSHDISDCQLPIANLMAAEACAIGNWQLAIGIN